VFVQTLFARVLRNIPSMLALLLPTDAVPCEIAWYMYLPMIAVCTVAGSYTCVGGRKTSSCLLVVVGIERWWVRSCVCGAKVDIKISRSTSGVRAARFDAGAAVSPTKGVHDLTWLEFEGRGQMRYCIYFCRPSLEDSHGLPDQTSDSVNMSTSAGSKSKPTEDPLLAILEPALKVGAFSGKCYLSPNFNAQGRNVLRTLQWTRHNNTGVDIDTQNH